jgi:hypothetical protein
MPITYRIDKINMIVFITATEEFTSEGYLGHKRNLTDDPDFDPYFSALFDFRNTTNFRISSVEMSEISMDLIFNERARRAFVVPTGEMYGMIRMFSILSNFESDVIQIFHEMAEARRWIGLDQTTNSN